MDFSGKLLVGVDDTPMARDALNLAALISLRTGATLVLAHVIQQESPSVAGWDDFRQGQRAEAERLFEQSVSNLGGEFQFETHTVLAKSDAQGLIDIAQELDVAAVVVGSSHRGAAGRVLIGSVGERLLHGAHLPVIVAPRSFEVQEHSMQRIGVAYDGAAESRTALETAVNFSRAARTDVKLLAVNDPSAFVVPMPPDMATLVNPLDLERAHHEHLTAAINEAVSAIESPPEISGEVLVGHPAEELGAAGSGADPVDLLVCGSRGYGPVRVVLLGSVSAKLVRSADCPVMVVPRS